MSRCGHMAVLEVCAAKMGVSGIELEILCNCGARQQTRVRDHPQEVLQGNHLHTRARLRTFEGSRLRT